MILVLTRTHTHTHTHTHTRRHTHQTLSFTFSHALLRSLSPVIGARHLLAPITKTDHIFNPPPDRICLLLKVDESGTRGDDSAMKYTHHRNTHNTNPYPPTYGGNGGALNRSEMREKARRHASDSVVDPSGFKMHEDWVHDD